MSAWGHGVRVCGYGIRTEGWVTEILASGMGKGKHRHETPPQFVALGPGLLSWLTSASLPTLPREPSGSTVEFRAVFACKQPRMVVESLSVQARQHLSCRTPHPISQMRRLNPEKDGNQFGQITQVIPSRTRTKTQIFQLSVHWSLLNFGISELGSESLCNLYPSSHTTQHM